MSGSLNKVTLIGNVGQDPEIRTAGNGRVANLRLATSESWKDRTSGERKEKTEWHSVAIFQEGLVETVEKYVKKGSKIYIEGQLRTREYSGSEGVKKQATEIVLQGFNGSMIMLDGPANREGGASAPRGGGQQQSGGQRRDAAPAAAGQDFDDVPF